MFTKGYYYVINLGIVDNFSTSKDPAYPGLYSRKPIAAGKLRRFWVLPSPQIIKPIVRSKF